jgi:hypothetical protein
MLRPPLSSSIVAALAMSCSTRPPDDTAAPLDVRVAEPAPVPRLRAPTADGDPCRRHRELNGSSLHDAIETARRGATKEPQGEPLSEQEVLDVLIASTAECKASGRGAWGLVVERVSPMPWDGWSGIRALLSLVYFDATGARSRVTPFESTPDGGLSTKDENFYYSHVDGAEVKSLATFDYDADGDAEVALVLSGKYHEGETWAWGRLYSAKDGAVRPYTPAASIPFSSVVDEDADGRPDLLGGEPYDDVFENCCSGFSSQLEGPPLLAHALPDGTFSRTDALAITVAKRACPAPPSALVAGGAKGWDVGPVHRAVACARLWGVDGTKILASIDRTLGTAKPKSRTKPNAGAKTPDVGAGDCDMTRCVSPNATREHAEAWVAVTPPITLR